MPDFERYSRQMLIEGFGQEGQERLAGARVTAVGLGGLGSPLAIYLAAAGVGRLTLCDYKEVDAPDLNRQVLHWEGDVGRAKADSALEKLRALNPRIRIEVIKDPVSRENVRGLVEGSDVVVDCLDNFDTRYLLNEACVGLGIPLVHAAVEGLRGQATTVVPGKSPCLRCVIPVAPQRKAVFPIIGFTAGFLAMVEAAETVKLITGVGETLAGKLLVADLGDNSYQVLETRKNPDCPTCGSR
ncbi:MAG: HesA/MoeB/ThiF family protein [Euryarchaeota archaeon]|nr:HesA/MoeB/ThiF family protein [Euryarchaeota archaeon]